MQLLKDWTAYPFSVPTIGFLDETEIDSRVVFFAGENGTGKSALLEAIAGHYAFGPEGSNSNIRHDSAEHNHSTDALVNSLRLSFDQRTGQGFSLSAESFFNTATNLDRLDDPKEIRKSPHQFFLRMEVSVYLAVLTERLSSRSLSTSFHVTDCFWLDQP